MPPAQASAFHTDTTGELVHTGVQVSRAPGARRASSMATSRPRAAQAGALLVASVIEGSAAERAGVAVGDELLAINGCEAASLPEECVAMTYKPLDPFMQKGSGGSGLMWQQKSVKGCFGYSESETLARREAAALLQHDADLVLLRAGVKAALGAAHMRLAALPIQVYPVHYASLAGCEQH